MAFTETDKLKAVAIVNIFETSRPFGDYAAYAVLNDGAGVSYGINQFTHRSGSLAAVIEKYLAAGADFGAETFVRILPLLRSATPLAIRTAAGNKNFENTLKAAAATKEMRAAQNAVAFERYLGPAISACSGSRFSTPLALAVIYDSINHGSWEKIRDRVLIPGEPGRLSFEKAWITEYVHRRHTWLRSVPRLRPTAYRTTFFLAQIARQNWELNLPLTVHGEKLTARHVQPVGASPQTSASETSAVPPNIPPDPSANGRLRVQAAPAKFQQEGDRSGPIDGVQQKVDAVAARYDQIETIVRTVLTRTDSAKSLWTTVAGTIWQSGWAIVSFVIGLPGEVWLVVALIAAALMLFYLYRQFVLGRIRENAGIRRPETVSRTQKL